MQADQLAEVGKPDAVAVPRHLFKNCEGATERLNADPLPVVGVVVDIGLRRLHQLGDRGLARSGLLLNGLLLGTRCHESHLHATVPHSIRPSERLNSALIARAASRSQHTTISIDVQYYGK